MHEMPQDEQPDVGLRYLTLLSREYPSQKAAAARIVALKTWMSLPKGTEYYFSDLHGEHRGFLRMLKSASGTIRDKIETIFSSALTPVQRDELAQVIYEPENMLRRLHLQGRLDENWYRACILRLVQVLKAVSAKYTRSMARRMIPEMFSGGIDELSYLDQDESRGHYHDSVVTAIIKTGIAGTFIASLSGAIRKLCVARLHILGDIYDRGAHPDLIMDELVAFPEVDIIWGNHDIHWLGAYLGNPALIASVVRQGISYNTFDLLEDGYGINLRPLSVFADRVYRDDPCLAFLQKDEFNENLYDSVSPEMGAKMQKAMAVIQFKLEGQLIARRPEYGMQNRDLLSRVNYETGTVWIADREYPLRDTYFPTVDPKNPLALSPGEAELMNALTASFRHGTRLQKHMRFLVSHGRMVSKANGQLLYHGCVPMTGEGEFAKVQLEGRELAGPSLFDYIESVIRKAAYLEYDSPGQREARDFLWYLWCGPLSPVFGKDRMATFERMLIEDKSTHKEEMNPYYRHVEGKDACQYILTHFGLDPKRGHIINGHIPVKLKRGESPVKGGGRLFMIDGGMSKAYQGTTGIGGYTLIYNSHNFSLAQHPVWDSLEDEPFDSPKLEVVEEHVSRQRVAETDAGTRMKREITDLENLIRAYRTGQVPEPAHAPLEAQMFDPGFTFGEADSKPEEE